MNIDTGRKILIFSSNWCGDCVFLNGFKEEIINENESWEFIEIDLEIEENKKYGQRFKIFGIPSFVALEDGEVIGELISKERKTKILINSWIKTLDVKELRN